MQARKSGPTRSRNGYITPALAADGKPVLLHLLRSAVPGGYREWAEHLDVSLNTTHRSLKAGARISVDFIYAVRAAFPQHTYESLFREVTSDVAADRTARLAA